MMLASATTTRAATASRRPVVLLAGVRWVSVTTTTSVSTSRSSCRSPMILIPSSSSSRRALCAVQNATIRVHDYSYWNNNNKNHGQHQQQQVRYFCAAPSPEHKEDDKNNDGMVARAIKTVVTPQNQFYALVSGGVVGTYAISRVFLLFTGFFTHLQPLTVAKWGFYTGFGCATMVGGLALMTADNMYIRADPVYKYCLNWVQKDTVVQSKLGDGIQAGSLRSYRLDAGKFELSAAGRPSLVWRPPRIQMIFDVTATGPPYRTGLVTCEAIKSGGFPPSLTTTFLKIDYETGNEGEVGGTREEDQTYFLKGNEQDFNRVSKRSGLSLEMLARAVHINKAAAGRQN